MRGFYTRSGTDFQRAKRRGYTPIAYILVRLLGALPDSALRAIVRGVGPMARGLSRFGREAELARLRRSLLHPHRLGEGLDQAVQRFDQLEMERQEAAA